MRNRNEPEKINVLSLRDHAYRYIKDKILTNQLYPGQTVVIDQLVKQMGISHTPLREALMLLELEGLVRTNRYKSLQITPITKEDVIDIYEMRILLEGWSANIVAELSDNDFVQSLEELILEAEEVTATEDFGLLIELDIEFHNAINSLVTNSAYKRIMHLINDQAARVRSLVEASRTTHWEKTIIVEHREILEAIRRNDGELASQRMVTHLKSAMSRAIMGLDSFKDAVKEIDQVSST